MRLALLIFLIALPIIEIGLLIKLGTVIGVWLTFALVIGTAILGGGLIVQNGFNSAVRVQESMAKGEVPLNPMMDSALVVTAGVLLITPGPIADCIGLLLLIPPVRRMLVGKMAGGLFGFTGAGTEEVRTETREEAARAARPQSDGPIIEGEFQRIGERPINGAPPRPEDRR